MAEAYAHPFGRENEVSLNKLWQSFCNHLDFGQWEWARSCITELNEQRELLGINTIDVLKKIAINPYKIWYALLCLCCLIPMYICCSYSLITSVHFLVSPHLSLASPPELFISMEFNLVPIVIMNMNHEIITMTVFRFTKTQVVV